MDIFLILIFLLILAVAEYPNLHFSFPYFLLFIAVYVLLSKFLTKCFLK